MKDQDFELALQPLKDSKIAYTDILLDYLERHKEEIIEGANSLTEE